MILGEEHHPLEAMRFFSLAGRKSRWSAVYSVGVPLGERRPGGKRRRHSREPRGLCGLGHGSLRQSTKDKCRPPRCRSAHEKRDIGCAKLRRGSWSGKRTGLCSQTRYCPEGVERIGSLDRHDCAPEDGRRTTSSSPPGPVQKPLLDHYCKCENAQSIWTAILTSAPGAHCPSTRSDPT